MSDDFTPDANHDLGPDDVATQQIHDRLLALGSQWRNRRVPTGRISAHLRSLVASEHLIETSNDYPVQEEFVLMNTPTTQPQQTPSPRRYLIPAIAAALVISLLGATFFIASRKGPATYSLTPTATAGLTATGITSPTSVPATATGLPASTIRLTYVRMIDATTGWATDDLKIYRTTDGGQTWHNLTPAGVVPVNPQGGPLSLVITVLNDKAAWFSDGQKIYRTTDAGQTWQPSSPPIQGSVSYLTFVDALHGWAIDNLGNATGRSFMNLLRTTDGGAHWTRIPFESGGHQSILVFLNATTGWIGGSSAGDPIYLLVTHDGGVTWQQQSLPNPMSQAFTAGVTALTFFDTRNGALSLVAYATASNAGGEYNYVTHDGGATWSIVGAPQSSTFQSTDFLDANHWWMVGGQIGNMSLAITSDGGRHWTTLNPGGTFNNAERVDFISATTGWAYSQTSNTPLLLQTADGGHTWRQIAPHGG
jgi:photosystem II stability/assembly factor-like uncharacterized protein